MNPEDADLSVIKALLHYGQQECILVVNQSTALRTSGPISDLCFSSKESGSDVAGTEGSQKGHTDTANQASPEKHCINREKLSIVSK